MLPWEVEIFRVGELLFLEISLVDVHHEEVPIGVSTDKNRGNTENENIGENNGSRVIEQKFFLTRRSAEIDVFCKILIYDNPYKWQRCNKSNDICIEKNTYFRDIPVEEIFVEQKNVQKNPLEIGEIGCHK